MEQIILASSSPRRHEIMDILEIPFTVIPPKIEIKLDPDLELEQAVLNVARAKSREVSALYSGHTVIGADTVVSIDGETLGKPQDERHARSMLGKLSGRVHSVTTAVWVCPGQASEGGSGFADTARVEFYQLSTDEINEYIATGEPFDKAGGYGIQGKGLKFVRSVYGDFYTVMGLPAARLWRFLKNMC